MLRQSARRGRLDALLHDKVFQNTSISGLANVLKPEDSTSRPAHVLSHNEVAVAHSTGKTLDQRHYNMLLQYLNNIGRDYNSVYAVTQTPHALGTLMLPPAAQQPYQITFEARTYSLNDSHVGNSHIQFYIPGAAGNATDTGYIEKIWELPLEGVWQTFFLVRQHRQLTPAQLRKTPYAYNPCSILQAKVVSTEESKSSFILEPQHIICHLVTYKNPPRTYGLSTGTMIVCWGLNRKRR